MAKLDDLIQQKQQRDEDWKAKKTAEREELGQLSDDAVMRVTSEPGAYLHYLDTQAINPRYSASNVMLAMAQNPEITYINSLEVWNRLGRSVNRDENGMKIRVSDTYVKDGREYHRPGAACPSAGCIGYANELCGQCPGWPRAHQGGRSHRALRQ